MKPLITLALLLSFSCLGADWRFKEDVDSFTDEVSYVLSASSDDMLGGFWLHCSKSGFSWMNLTATGMLKGKKYKNHITFRINKSTPIEISGVGRLDLIQLSSGNAKYPELLSSIAALKKDDRFKYRVTDAAGEHYIADISAFNAAVEITAFFNKCKY